MSFKVPIPMKDPGDYVSYDDAERLIGSAQSERDWIILALLWRDGLRAHEIGLMKAKFIQDENIIIVHGKGNKLDRIPCEPELYNRLKIFTSGMNPELYIFQGYTEKGLCRSTIHKMVRKYSELSGVLKTKSNRAVHPHSLRHSLAIYLVEMGVHVEKISQILRHSSLVPTTYYLKHSLKELTDDYMRVWQK